MDQVKTKQYIVLFIVLVALIIYTYSARFGQVESSPIPALESIPISIDNYTGRDEYQEPASLRVLDADTTIFRSYRRSDDMRTIWLFMGHFRALQEKSQIHSPKHCLPGAGWNIVKESSTKTQIGNRASLLKYLIISDGSERRIVLYWFSTPREIVTDEFRLKWYQVKTALLGKPQAATFVRFSTTIPLDEDEGVTLRELVTFIEAISPEIENVLY